MTSVAILPVEAASGETEYQAVSGRRRTVGRTAGEALDAMTAILTTNECGTLLVLQQFRPDAFFTSSQKNRLQELMLRWRESRDHGDELCLAEQTELEGLVAAETDGARLRADEMIRDLQP